MATLGEAGQSVSLGSYRGGARNQGVERFPCNGEKLPYFTQ